MPVYYDPDNFDTESDERHEIDDDTGIMLIKKPKLKIKPNKKVKGKEGTLSGTENKQGRGFWQADIGE